MWATLNSHTDCVRLLLSSGAETEATNAVRLHFLRAHASALRLFVRVRACIRMWVNDILCLFLFKFITMHGR